MVLISSKNALFLRKSKLLVWNKACVLWKKAWKLINVLVCLFQTQDPHVEQLKVTQILLIHFCFVLAAIIRKYPNRFYSTSNGLFWQMLNHSYHTYGVSFPHELLQHAYSMHFFFQNKNCIWHIWMVLSFHE